MNIVSAMNFAFGYAHLAAGRVDDAVPALREALELYGRAETAERHVKPPRTSSAKPPY